jgi:hypothetical protein
MKTVCIAAREGVLVVGGLCTFCLLAFAVNCDALAQPINQPPVNQPINNPSVPNGPVGIFFQQPVGGVAIRPDGLVENAAADALGGLHKLRERLVGEVPADLRGRVPLRKISLRRLDTALAAAIKADKPLPAELCLLGGLQQIRYIFVYPEQKDIVLVGPAEEWRVDTRGNIVGKTAGRPPMNLDDLVVALRAAAGAGAPAQRVGGEIACSIDPTDKGRAQLKTYAKTLHKMGDPNAIEQGIEEALGKQQVSVSGVPGSSHFAAVLVAADYRMKRLAMAFDRSPVKGLPSFMEMYSGGATGMSNMMPRWWLEPKYDGLLRDKDGLAWEFQGAGVKCMTEEDFQAADGSREHTGRANPVARRWADNMTRHYDELAHAEPVFGELQNCIDLAVAAALIVRENLPHKAGCSLSTLLDGSLLKPVELPVPSQVDSRVSMLRKGSRWVISASGGVTIRSSEIVARARPGAAVDAARDKLAPASHSGWYSN